jgi:hypothetical protein
MGDRVSVYLTIPVELINIAVPLFSTKYYDENLSDDGKYMFYSFEECNYGNLSFTDKLIKHGIPFDKEWEEGSDFGAGNESYRYTPTGESIFNQVYRSSLSINIYNLLNLINNYEDLKEYILTKQKENEVLPWDNQIEYGRIHRARVLITG